MRAIPEATDTPLVIPAKPAPAPVNPAPTAAELFRSGDWMPKGLAEKPAAPSSHSPEELKGIADAQGLTSIFYANVIVGTYYANGHHEIHADRWFFEGGEEEGYESEEDAEEARDEFLRGAR